MPGQGRDVPPSLKATVDRLSKDLAALTATVAALTATVAANERKYATRVRNAGGIAGVRPSALTLPLVLCRPPRLNNPPSPAAAAFACRSVPSSPGAAAARDAGGEGAAVRARAAVRTRTTRAARAAAEADVTPTDGKEETAAAAETAIEAGRGPTAAGARVEAKAAAAEVEAAAAHMHALNLPKVLAGISMRACASQRLEAKPKKALVAPSVVFGQRSPVRPSPSPSYEKESVPPHAMGAASAVVSSRVRRSRRKKTPSRLLANYVGVVSCDMQDSVRRQKKPHSDEAGDSRERKRLKRDAAVRSSYRTAHESPKSALRRLATAVNRYISESVAASRGRSMDVIADEYLDGEDWLRKNPSLSSYKVDVSLVCQKLQAMTVPADDVNEHLEGLAKLGLDLRWTPFSEEVVASVKGVVIVWIIAGKLVTVRQVVERYVKCPGELGVEAKIKFFEAMARLLTKKMDSKDFTELCLHLRPRISSPEKSLW